MKNNLVKIGVNIFGLVAIVAILSVFSSIVAFGGAVTYAMVGAAISAEPVTTTNVKAGSPDLDVDYISKKVVQMRPAATPLDTIMRNIGTQVSIKSFVSDYYAVDSRPLSDTVHAAYTHAGDGATTADLAVHNVTMWNTDDTCMFPTVNGADSKPLVCFIISRNVSNGTIKIQPLNGNAGAGTMDGELVLPTIPIDSKIVRLGPAKHELDAQTSPYAIIPVKSYNYMQIFMAQVEESTFQRIHDKEVDWNFSDYESQNIYDMRATMEYSFLFGVRSKFVDKVNAKERYTTGGITRFITNALTYGTGGSDRTIDDATFVDWTKEVFTGNCGADTRLLFGGDGLMANLSKVNTVQKQIEAKATEVKWGITFQSIETNFGKLLFKHHPLFDIAGWGDNGLVLDINHIEKHTFKPMATRKLDLKASGTRNVDAVVIEETTGVITRYPDTHCIISPKA
jgi:hypothetical protein